MQNFSVKIDENLFNSAAAEGKANFRSTDNQINFWAKVGDLKGLIDSPSGFFLDGSKKFFWRL